MTNTPPSKASFLPIFHVLVFFAFEFLFGFIPSSHIPALGMRIIGIFIGLLYAWTFLSFTWPSMVSILALAFSGYYESPVQAYVAVFSNQILMFMLLTFVFVAYCEKSGLTRKLAHWFLSRPSLVGHPWRFTLAIVFGCFICGILINPTAMIFVYWSMVYEIFDDIGYKKGDAYPSQLCWGIVIASVMAYACKPWDSIGLMTIGTLDSVANGAYAISYGDFMLSTTPHCIATTAGFLLVMKFIFKPDLSPLQNLSAEYLAEIRSQLSLNTQEKIAFAAMVALIVGLLLPSIVPASSALYSFASGLNFIVVIAIILAAVCTIQIKGQHIMDFNECARIGIRWDQWWLLGAALVVSAALSSNSAEVGITAFISEFVTHYFSGTTGIAFVLLFMLILNLFTQVTHNLTIIAIGIPISFQICLAAGLNPACFAIIVSLAAAGAFATPGSASCTALGFSNVEWIGFNHSFKYGLTTWIVSLISLYLIGLPCAALVFGFGL